MCYNENDVEKLFLNKKDRLCKLFSLNKCKKSSTEGFHVWIYKKIFGTAQDRTVRKYSKIVQQVNAWDEKFQSLSDEALRSKTREFRERLAKRGNPRRPLARSLCRRQKRLPPPMGNRSPCLWL